MSKPDKYLYYNPDLCMGCHACEIACKMEHNLPAGVNRVRVMITGPILTKGKLELKFQSIRCMHCSNSPCTEACPSKAIYKRLDGIVNVNKSLCIGCRSCAASCPHNAIDFHPNTQIAEICDLCCNRLDEGKLPFCLKHCMTGALFYGTLEEFNNSRINIPGDKGIRNE